MATELESLMKFEEAQRYLRVSRSTLLRLMWAGKITGHKVGGTWRFYVKDVQSLLEQDLNEDEE